MKEEDKYQKEEHSPRFSEEEDLRQGAGPDPGEYADDGSMIDRTIVGSAMDNFSDRINNRFDQLDNRRKGLIVLSVGIAAFLLGIFFVYRTISFLF